MSGPESDPLDEGECGWPYCDLQGCPYTYSPESCQARKGLAIFSWTGLITVSPEDLDRWAGLREWPSLAWFKDVFAVDVMESHVFLVSYDVVGKCDQREIENNRPAGVLFRYFLSHRARIDDLGARIDGFRKRSTVLRKSGMNSSLLLRRISRSTSQQSRPRDRRN